MCTLYVGILLFLTTVQRGFESQPALEPSLSKPPTPALVIPFDYTNRHLYLTLTDDRLGPLTLLLDTGTARTTLSIARTTGLQLHRSFWKTTIVTSGWGSHPVEQKYRTLPVTLRSKETPVLTGQAIALNLDAMSQHLGRPIDGILGWDFFQAWCSTLDYSARRLTLRPLSDCAPPSPRGNLHGDWSSHGMRLPAAIRFRNGRSAFARLLFDTGDDESLSLTDRFRSAADLPPPAGPANTSISSSSWGVNGAYAADLVPLASLDFDHGHLHLEPDGTLNVSIARPGSMHRPHWWTLGGIAARSTLRDGAIGNALLEHITWTIDPAAKRIYAVPRPSSPGEE